MRIQKRTKHLTVSAMLCALGVILLALGALIDVLDITSAVLASLLCVYAVIEIGGAYPWMIWLSTSILSLLLLPLKTPALFYALFAGFYPILKEKLEKLARPLAFVLKLLIFHVSLALICLCLSVFFPAALDMEGIKWLPVALYIGCVLCFVLYDYALSHVITFYLVKLRRRFQIK